MRNFLGGDFTFQKIYIFGFFFKKSPKIYIYIFLESEVSPQKNSHTPPLGVFLTPSLSVQLKILPYVTLGGGAEEYIFISGLYSPNFLVHSSKSLDNKSL